MYRKSNCLIIILSLIAFFGCTKTFYIKTPTPSSIVYDQDYPEETVLKVTDQRSEKDRQLSEGTLSVVLKDMGDEITFLGNNIEAALNSRGINIKCNNDKDANLVLNAKKYRIRNLRTTGFSPYWTFTTFSGDLNFNGQKKRIAFYFKAGKVPVWAFKEVEDPCYNVPVSLLVKEIASKINRYYYGLQSSSDKINTLFQDINENFDEHSFLKVLELGYTNNKDAIEPLVKLANHSDSMVRVCAISSLGVLGAIEKFDFIKNIYNTSENIEKSMALKAIGDLDTPEADDFLKSVKQSSDYKDEMIREVVDLYL